jgi:hypothetical protein
MSTNVQHLLETFETLPEPEKHELASEILRWSAHAAHPNLSDDEFVRAADEVFVDLDRREDGSSTDGRG